MSSISDEDAIYYRWCESAGYDPDKPTTWRIWARLGPTVFDTYTERDLSERDVLR